MNLLILHPVSIWSLERFLVAAQSAGHRVTILTANPSIFDDKTLNKCEEIIVVKESTECADELMQQVSGKVFDIVVAGSEFAVVSSDIIASNMGCYSNDVKKIKSARNKKLMRAAFRHQGLPQPEVLGQINSLDELDLVVQEHFVFPIVIKPVDMINSLFVTVCNNENELKHVAKKIFNYTKFDLVNHSFIGEVLLEEFAQGEEYSVEALVKGGELIFRNVTKKILSPFPNRFEIGHIVGEDILIELHKDIDDICVNIAIAWGMPNGVIHLEMKVFEGEIKIIEAAARIPGDRISALIELKYGISLENEFIALRGNINSDVHFLQDRKQAGYFAVKFYFENDFDKILNNHDAIKIIDEQKYIIKKANKISNEHYDVSNRVGHQIVHANLFSDLIKWEFER